MRTYKLIILSLCIVLISCEDVIEWDVDSDQIKLVVEGRVTNEFKRHKIILTETADYFNPGAPNGVNGAVVTVSDGENTYMFEETSGGIYLSVVSFEGMVGKEYTLRIELQSPLGESSFFTASSKMMPPFSMDSLYSEKQSYFDDDGVLADDSLFVLGLYGQEVAEVDNSYLFEIFSNETLETDSLSNFSYFDDAFLEGTYFEDFLFYAMNEGATDDSVTVFMYSLEDEYLEFIEALLIESEGAEPLGLSGPPANVIGNLSNGGLGYFYSASVDTMSTVLN